MKVSDPSHGLLEERGGGQHTRVEGFLFYVVLDCGCTQL